jgi:hypothetical protein
VNFYTDLLGRISPQIAQIGAKCGVMILGGGLGFAGGRIFVDGAVIFRFLILFFNLRVFA